MNKKLKLMLVDDDPDFIDYARQMIKLVPDLRLKKTATDPTEALRYLLNKRVDMLLLDVDMPQLDGFQLMKQIQHLINPCDPSVPPLFVVLCSGFENNPEDCFKHRATNYIQKPLTIEKLIEAKIVIQRSTARLSVKKNKETLTKVRVGYDEGLAEEDLITIKEAEGILGVKRGKIKKMRDEGKLTDFGKDGRIRLSRKEVEEARVWYSIPKGKI